MSAPASPTLPTHPSHPSEPSSSIGPPATSESPSRAPLSKRLAAEAAFSGALSGPTVDLGEVRRLAFQGIPEKHRALFWAVLLEYLPLDRSQWDSTRTKARALYRVYCEEFMKDVTVPDVSEPSEEGESGVGDHPLSEDRSSPWNIRETRRKLLEVIDTDVPRTMPSLGFFHTPGTEAESHDSAVDLGHGRLRFSRRGNALRRILFIFAILNPGIGYVQGMSDLLAPLYYVQYQAVPSLGLSDPAAVQSAEDDVEADSFFVFSAVMAHLRSVFVREMDVSGEGIQACLSNLDTLLARCDPELHHSLASKRLGHQLFAFKWVTLLFSQDFALPDVLRIWDSLFADSHRFCF
eukprot:RCo022766